MLNHSRMHASCVRHACTRLYTTRPPDGTSSLRSRDPSECRSRRISTRSPSDSTIHPRDNAFVSFAELAASNVPFVSCKSSRSRTTTQWQPDMYMHRCVWREVRTCQHSSSPHILQQVLENVTLDEIAFDHLQLALTSDSHAVHAQNHPQGQLLHHHANLRPQQHDQHFDTVSP